MRTLFILPVALIAVTFAGCSADSSKTTKTADPQAHERQLHAKEHPGWAVNADRKVTAACRNEGVVSTTGIHGRDWYNDGGASETIALNVVCKDGTVHTVIINTPDNVGE